MGYCAYWLRSGGECPGFRERKKSQLLKRPVIRNNEKINQGTKVVLAGAKARSKSATSHVINPPAKNHNTNAIEVRMKGSARRSGSGGLVMTSSSKLTFVSA